MNHDNGMKGLDRAAICHFLHQVARVMHGVHAVKLVVELEPYVTILGMPPALFVTIASECSPPDMLHTSSLVVL